MMKLILEILILKLKMKYLTFIPFPKIIKLIHFGNV